MARQPIKYWSTTIEATKTASEIVQMLVEYKARETAVEWDSSGEPIAVKFTINDEKRGLLPVRLEAKIDSVYKYLRANGPIATDHQRLLLQSKRIAWRHIKDLLEQQLLAIKIGQSSLVEQFFYAIEVVTPDGQSGTMGDWMSTALEQGGVFTRIQGGRIGLPALPSAAGPST